MAEDTNEGAPVPHQISLEESLERIRNHFEKKPERLDLERVFLDDDKDPNYVYIGGYKAENGQSNLEIRLQRMFRGNMNLYHNVGSNIDASYELGRLLQELDIDVTSIGGHLYDMTPEKQEKLNKYNADLTSRWKNRKVGKSV